MGNFWLKLKVWTKGILFGLVLLYLLAFVFKNQANPAQIWYAPNHAVGSTSLLVSLFAFCAGVVVTILVRTLLATARQVRELQDRNRERAAQDMQVKASMLRTRPDPGPEPGETPLP